MKWQKVDRKEVPAFEDVLVSDGKKVVSAWLETIQPEEDLVFIDCYTRETLEEITHWMPYPKPPHEEECPAAFSKRGDNLLNHSS